MDLEGSGCVYMHVYTEQGGKMAEGGENEETRSNLIVAGSFGRQSLTKQLFSKDCWGEKISPHDKLFPSLLPTHPLQICYLIRLQRANQSV